MSTYDQRAQATAGRMLAPKSRGGKGQEVTLNQPGSAGAYDPMTDTVTGGTAAQQHKGSGVEDRFSAFSVASGVVGAGDVRFMLSPLKTNGQPMPQPVADSWTLTMGGKDWTIKRVERVAPAGVVAYYDLMLRA